MAILDKLQTQGSVLTDLDGKTPPSYDGVSQYQKDLETSQLDLNNKIPKKYQGISQYQKGLIASQLDLVKPTKYLDNLPT
jgi:hypothetical protein